MLRLCGSQMTPPLPPPSGMSTTAHFQVIHVARARTVSSVSCGWKRMPPLFGPRASLCCTRNPRNTLTFPSSMRTGMANWNSRIGHRSRSRVPWSRSRMSATLSNWAWAISNGLNGFDTMFSPLAPAAPHRWWFTDHGTHASRCRSVKLYLLCPPGPEPPSGRALRDRALITVIRRGTPTTEDGPSHGRPQAYMPRIRVTVATRSMATM